MNNMPIASQIAAEILSGITADTAETNTQPPSSDLNLFDKLVSRGVEFTAEQDLDGNGSFETRIAVAAGPGSDSSSTSSSGLNLVDSLIDSGAGFTAEQDIDGNGSFETRISVPAANTSGSEASIPGGSFNPDSLNVEPTNISADSAAVAADNPGELNPLSLGEMISQLSGLMGALSAILPAAPDAPVVSDSAPVVDNAAVEAQPPVAAPSTDSAPLEQGVAGEETGIAGIAAPLERLGQLLPEIAVLDAALNAATPGEAPLPVQANEVASEPAAPVEEPIVSDVPAGITPEATQGSDSALAALPQMILGLNNILSELANMLTPMLTNQAAQEAIDTPAPAPVAEEAPVELSTAPATNVTPQTEVPDTVEELLFSLVTVLASLTQVLGALVSPESSASQPANNIETGNAATLDQPSIADGFINAALPFLTQALGTETANRTAGGLDGQGVDYF